MGTFKPFTALPAAGTTNATCKKRQRERAGPKRGKGTRDGILPMSGSMKGGFSGVSSRSCRFGDSLD